MAIKLKQNNVVLVTRPKHQATEFVTMLTAKGFKSLLFPCIEIKPVVLSDELMARLKTLNDNDLIVFISVNAVEKATELMRQLNIKPESITAKIATIGRATYKAAISLGFNVTLNPESGFNSDALLGLSELQSASIKGQQCLIIRGMGGLATLADELSKRGVMVYYAEVYQRSKPEVDENISRQELSDNWEKLQINAVTVTSNESLQNLYDMLKQPAKEAMLKTALIVASQRGIELAKRLGFKSVILAQSALNQHMLEAVENNWN